VGQCFKQQKTILVNIPEIPFFGVASGLGNAKRNSLLLIPIVYGNECLGVMEFASLQEYSNETIEFAEKVAGYLGSVCFNHRNSKQTQKLLQTLEERNQEMHEKEEELRQNIEEISASQEEMLQKQIIIDQQSGLMKMIVDYIPFPVFVKDEEGRYTLINKAEAELLGKPEEEIIGYSDQAFVQLDSEWQVIKESDRRVLESTHAIELDEQEFTTPNGKHYLFKTTKVPFVNTITGKKNILGVSIDLMTFKLKERI
jgi:PAS domain S-box-containing protein